MSNELITAEQAFQSMSRFLMKYYERSGRNGEVGLLLSEIQLLPDGRPADPAVWEDWLGAIRTVLADSAY